MESSSSRSVSRRTKADTRVIACVRARVQASLSMRRFARERERRVFLACGGIYVARGNWLCGEEKFCIVEVRWFGVKVYDELS